MNIRATSPRRQSVIALTILAAGLAALLVANVAARDSQPSSVAPSDVAAPHGLDGDQRVERPIGTSDRQPSTGRLSAPNPIGVRIPTIAVAAETIPLGLRVDGSIEVPEDFDQTGWWADGPEPGEPGPAVILGHVDSVRGPAVFSRLGDLSIGDVVHVDRDDGTTISYVVDRIEQHPKDDFPTDAVYGRDGEDSVLRLVTCGGQFDRDARSYVDNIIVFASMTRS